MEGEEGDGVGGRKVAKFQRITNSSYMYTYCMYMYMKPKMKMTSTTIGYQAVRL